MFLMNKLKIGTRLTLAFFILLILTGILSFLAIKNMEKLSQHTENLYNHPFKVSTTVLRIERDIFKLNRVIENIQRAENKKEVSLSESKRLQKRITQDFDVALDRFLDDKKKLESTKQLFIEWYSILNEKTALLEDDKKEKQWLQLEKESSQLLDQLEKRMVKIVHFSKNTAEEFVKNAKSVSDNTTLLFSQMYDHPFTVSKAILRIDKDINQLAHSVRALENADTLDEKTVLLAKFEKYARNIAQNFELILSRSLGNKVEIETTKTLFEEWKAVLAESIKLLQNDEKQRNLNRLQEQSDKIFGKLEKGIADIVVFSDNQIEQFLSQSPIDNTQSTDSTNKNFSIFTLNKVIMQIDRNIFHLKESIKMLRLAQTSTDKDVALSEFEKYNNQLVQNFDFILDFFKKTTFFPEQKNSATTIHPIFLAWQALLIQESLELQNNEEKQNLKKLQNKSDEILEKLKKQIEEIIDSTNNKADEFLENAKMAGNETSALFNKMYQHPFTESKATLRITANISRLHDEVENLSFFKMGEEREECLSQVVEYEKKIAEDFQLVEERALGNKQDIEAAQQLFTDWKVIVDKKTVLLSDIQREKTLEKLTRLADEKLTLLDTRMEELVDFADSKADEFLDMTKKVKNDTFHFMYGLIVAVLIIGIAFSILITRSIVKPLKQAVIFSNQLAEGQLSTRVINAHSPDETTQLLSTMNDMADRFQALITEVSTALDGLAKGEVYTAISGDFLGDFSKIKTALEMTAARLSEAKNKRAIETWIKTGLARLNNLMSGEQDIENVAKKIISFLTTYVEAHTGLIYLFKESPSKNALPFLEMTASYAYVASENTPTRFALGEGLVGQVALDKSILHRQHEPEEYAYIVQSGLAQAVPNHVILLPFLYEKTVRGVIEIGSSQALTSTQRDFLKQVMLPIGIAINATESRDKMEELLQRTQVQSKELRVKTETLERQHVELQQINEELQAQSEELQTQQEELRQVNEELEIRALDLEHQKNEINRKNRDLEKSKQEIELASRYKSEFLANMSHELRTPLNSLLILAQILSENRGDNLTEKQVEYARTMYSAGSDLLVLINEILDLSKVESGKIEIHIESLVMGDLIESIEQKFRPIAEEKGLLLNIDIAQDFPQLLQTDMHRLKQILNNLLSNAFKFTHRGTITLSMSRVLNGVHLPLVIDKPLAIHVIDTGIGIPKNKQSLVFEAFRQADGTTSRKYGGTGLGLSISQQLARLLGGDLIVQSEEGQGSTFTLYLPENPPMNQIEPVQQSIHQRFMDSMQHVEEKPSLRIAETVTTTEEIFEEDTPPFPDDRDIFQTGNKSILVIEDDQKFLSILVSLVRERDFKVLVAEDGTTGLQLAERYLPSAIILDIGLPKLDGWGVMERLKNNPETRHIPVHFMSAADQQSQDAKRMGAIGYLSKPINMGELDQAFKKIEQCISNDVKKVLLVTTSVQRKQQVLDLIQYNEVEVTVVNKYTDIKQQLQNIAFDCMIIDMNRESKLCAKLLKQFSGNDSQYLTTIPIIIYADRELNHEEEIALKQCENTITVKSVHSPERLLDETTLFLHQLEAKLPKEKRKMLKLVHDKEAILVNKKALIVDDDIRNTFSLMSFLEGKNMEVIVGHNGKEALELLDDEKNQDVALVLMDIMMPEMDGYETIRRIRAKKQFRKLPVIALTAKAMKGDKAKCIEAGANDYVSKPVDTDKLLSLMRVWLYR